MFYRDLCILPAVAVAPPYLYVANPPYTYTHEMKVLKFNLKEQILPYFHSMQQIARPRFLQFPDPKLVQRDSGIKKPHRLLLLRMCFLWLLNATCRAFTLLFHKQERWKLWLSCFRSWKQEDVVCWFWHRWFQCLIYWSFSWISISLRT